MKTGIIYCPKHAGFTSVTKRWEKISNLLQQYGIEYDLIQSESAQSVERLVTMLIHNGYDTIILCGGDGALNDATNCLMKEEKSVRERVVIGVIPNGLMNDFAAFWGFKENDLEHVIESIKTRRIRRVDAGCISYATKEGKHETRYFLNCVNIGLVAAIQRLKMKTRKYLWSRKVSYVVTLFLLAFQRMSWKMKYTINYEKETHSVMSLCVGSAHGYGQTPNAVPYNGMLDVTAIHNSALTQIFHGICFYLMGRILNSKIVKPYRGHEMEIELPKNTPVTIDGQTCDYIDSGAQNIRIWVEQEEINFIIEK